MKIYFIGVAFAILSCNANAATELKLECGIIPQSGEALRRRRSTGSSVVPWHATVYKRTTPHMLICSGALVTTKAVISVAHCYWDNVNNKLQSADNFAVAVGKSHREWDSVEDQHAQKSDVSEIQIPPRFLGFTANFQKDIAVLTLKTAVTFNLHVRPVCLDFDLAFEQRQLQENALGKVSGWGFAGPEEVLPKVLKVLDIPYVSIEECLRSSPPEYRGFITADKICAGLQNGTSLCRGDSGNALTFPVVNGGKTRYYLRGVASTSPRTERCNTKPSINLFTQVSKHEQFIKQFI